MHRVHQAVAPQESKGQRDRGVGPPKSPQLHLGEHRLCFGVFSGCSRKVSVYARLSVLFGGGQGIFGAPCPAYVVILHLIKMKSIF